MTRRAPIAALLIFTVVTMGILSPTPTYAQAPQSSEDLQTFRVRLMSYMQDLAAVQPSRVPEGTLEAIARLDQRELEILQRAFPKDQAFWSAPRTLQRFIDEHGGVHGPQAAVTPFAAPSNSSGLRSSPGQIHSQAADTTPPTVTSFAFVPPTEITEGGTFVFSYAVTDSGGSGLKTLELWRALNDDGSPNADTWTTVGKINISGDSSSSTFSYKPQSFGTYWFGVHALDGAGNVDYEPAPIKGVVKFDPNKQCPTGFNYEALWLARDAEKVAEIAKEMIPEDLTTSPAYLIAAIAWSVATGMRFTVDQIYARWQDCEAGKVAAMLDVPSSTRASQSTVDSIKTRVDSLEVSRLDTSVSSRATQTSVDNVKSKVDTLDTGKLDANVSSRATQTSVDGVKSKVDTLDTTKLDANVSTRATQTSVDGVKSKVDTLDTTRLDVPVSTRAQEFTLLQRAAAIDLALITAQNKLNTLDTSRLDVSVLTRASQTSVDDIRTTIGVQETLQIQVVEMERNRRYLVYVTKRGAPVAGATIQNLQVLTVDKNKVLTTVALTPDAREVAPGILDVTVTLPNGVTGEAFVATVNHVQGTSSLAGSTIWVAGISGR